MGAVADVPRLWLAVTTVLADDRYRIAAQDVAASYSQATTVAERLDGLR